MKQFQAGFILEAVREALTDHSERNNCNLELQGLLRQFSTFNVQTGLSLEMQHPVSSLYAVASNIITRGLPTYPDLFIEEAFSAALGMTERKEDLQSGKISYTFKKTISQELLSGQSFFNALHAIDPRYRNRNEYLNTSDLDSEFERKFITELIPDQYGYLAQVLEKQRERSSLTRDGNTGRMDFCHEIPYDIAEKRVNRYNSEVQIRHHKLFIAEVDGERYHTQLVDDQKDFEIAQMGGNIRHVRENFTFTDISSFIREITANDYINAISRNYNDPHYLLHTSTLLVLAPIAIARVQRMILQYLLSDRALVNVHKTLKIAVLERDMPCGYLAIKSLTQLLDRLNMLSSTPISLPELEVQVFASPEFIQHPLNGGQTVKPVASLNKTEFDLVIDVSVLRRAGVFNDDLTPDQRTIVIRNAHYVHYKTQTGVISAGQVIYRPVVEHRENEVFEPVAETSDILRGLLRDLFRKIDFRPGQLPILNRALQLKSVIGLLPTGGGKSLTYQLSAMLQPGVTVIVDPIRSLMVDQFAGLRDNGIDKCEYINSTLTTAERVYNQNILLVNGSLQLIFVSPERFVIDEFRNALLLAHNNGHAFSYVVIDEVHCVSEWGHDFRTPYLNLGDNAQEYCKTFNGTSVPLFGLTATASFDVLADIERELNVREDDGNAVVRFENTVRDEINYFIQEAAIPRNIQLPTNQWEARELVGSIKQDIILDIIAKKERWLYQFNKASVIREIRNYSFNNYLSLQEQSRLIAFHGDASQALQAYINSGLKRLYYQDPFPLAREKEENHYKYGIIVFMPHRSGWLGIRSSAGAQGLYDHPSVNVSTADGQYPLHTFNQERMGGFMGAGDDGGARLVDEESFFHLHQFKHGLESVMVATKAFGMGIDKPDIRLTIHINLPQSIESFVQEAGRAGRDGRISTGIILYSDNQFVLGNGDPFHVDMDVLLYFHRNSFKGKMKEKVMIYELRNKITFPNATNLQQINESMNQVFGTEQVQFVVKPGGANHQNRIFINTMSGDQVGYVYLDTGATGTYQGNLPPELTIEMVAWLKKQLPFNQGFGVMAIRAWLYQMVVNTQAQIGLEQIMAGVNEGESVQIKVPFKNRFYSKPERSLNNFILNQAHSDSVLETEAINHLIENIGFTKATIGTILRESVFNQHDYITFITALNIMDPVTLQRLLSESDHWSVQLQKAYYLPRNQSDTSKAIYRLVTAGVIDTYTIDYQNELYEISFTKRSPEEYFLRLQELVARYTSRSRAAAEIAQLKEDSEVKIRNGNATVIGICMDYLTDFIYLKIKEKRLQAIYDMVNLCRIAIGIQDPVEQNKYVKDDIYYYFNAKYSRLDFVEKTPAGNLPASMPNDLNNNLGIGETIDKYLDLCENANTGEFMNNIKHLRGSCMRMLRSNPDRPQFRLLKAFSLFVLADTVRDLLGEAKEELLRGVLDWETSPGEELNGIEFIATFRQRLQRHIMAYDLDPIFNDIEDRYYALYYKNWTRKFSDHLTIQ